MSYRRHRDEHRATLIDHRMSGVRGPGVPLDPDEAEDAALPAQRGGRGLRLLSRSRSVAAATTRRRYRHVRPAFAPLPLSDPLPYEDPMERALRWNS